MRSFSGERRRCSGVPQLAAAFLLASSLAVHPSPRLREARRRVRGRLTRRTGFSASYQAAAENDPTNWRFPVPYSLFPVLSPAPLNNARQRDPRFADITVKVNCER